MRENMGLYRGKRKDNGEWAFGTLYKQTHYYGDPCAKWYIITSTESLEYYQALEYHEVDPETVGQLTGFYDGTKWKDLTPEEQQAFLHQPDGWENAPEVWHGTPIFEGDILQFDDVGETGYEYKEGFDFTNRAAVVWENGRWELGRFLSANSGVYEDMTGRSYHEEFILVFGSSKVIGNIHDNPELLSKG